VDERLLIHSFTGAKGFWATDVGPYYLEKSGIDLLRDVVKDHNLKGIKSRKVSSNLLVMDFGEISASWHLETNLDQTFLKLRWVESPFETTSGIDLVGLKKEKWDVSYVEVKTRTSNSGLTSCVSGSSNCLADQLDSNRCDARFNSRNMLQGSKSAIVRIIKEKILKGEFPNDPSIIKKILRATSYNRYGFVIHPSPIIGTLFQPAVAQLGSGPIFVDFSFDDMNFELRGFEQDSTI